MPSIGDLLSEAARDRLAERLAELQALDRLVREREGCRPPDPVPTLAGLAEESAS